MMQRMLYKQQLPPTGFHKWSVGSISFRRRQVNPRTLTITSALEIHLLPLVACLWLGPTIVEKTRHSAMRRLKDPRQCSSLPRFAASIDNDQEQNFGSDGGLAIWREKQQEDSRLPLPVIFFSALDLLLLGHTKRMHLFEPRWVDMVDTARKQFGGVIGFLYFKRPGEVLPFATVAEIIAFQNLGSQGRVVTVRGVARALVRSLSPQVSDRDNWGVAMVNELAETLPQDSTDLDSACVELSNLCSSVDLSEPGDDASELRMRDKKSDKAKPNPQTPQLWTHERTSYKTDFSGDWDRRLASVRNNFQDVESLQIAGAPSGEKAKVAVACLYAALGAIELVTRAEIFMSKDEGLVDRMRALADKLKEAQGMATARRSLARVFTEQDKSSDDNADEGSNL